MKSYTYFVIFEIKKLQQLYFDREIRLVGNLSGPSKVIIIFNNSNKSKDSSKIHINQNSFDMILLLYRYSSVYAVLGLHGPHSYAVFSDVNGSRCTRFHTRFLTDTRFSKQRMILGVRGFLADTLLLPYQIPKNRAYARNRVHRGPFSSLKSAYL